METFHKHLRELVGVVKQLSEHDRQVAAETLWQVAEGINNNLPKHHMPARNSAPSNNVIKLKVSASKNEPLIRAECSANMKPPDSSKPSESKLMGTPKPMEHSYSGSEKSKKKPAIIVVNVIPAQEKELSDAVANLAGDYDDKQSKTNNDVNTQEHLTESALPVEGSGQEMDRNEVGKDNRANAIEVNGTLYSEETAREKEVIQEFAIQDSQYSNYQSGFATENAGAQDVHHEEYHGAGHVEVYGGPEGTQEYEIPSGTEVEEYRPQSDTQVQEYGPPSGSPQVEDYGEVEDTEEEVVSMEEVGYEEVLSLAEAVEGGSYQIVVTGEEEGENNVIQLSVGREEEIKHQHHHQQEEEEQEVITEQTVEEQVEQKNNEQKKPNPTRVIHVNIKAENKDEWLLPEIRRLPPLTETSQIPPPKGRRRRRRFPRPKTQEEKGLKFDDEGNLQEGILPPDPEDTICQVCGKKLHNHSNLIVHMRTHTGERPFKCALCPREFTAKSNWTRHMRLHRGEKPFTCDICKRSFSEKKSMQAHRRTHTGERPYQCPDCGLSFAQQSTLMTHAHIHTGWKGHLCDMCGKAFRQSTALAIHKKRHLDIREYNCDLCENSFVTLRDLDRHKLTHKGEKVLECNECSKKFTREDDLEDHHNIHSGTKPYKCVNCPERFHSRAAVNRHKAASHKAGSFKCTDCDKTFHSSTDRAIHMLAVHSQFDEKIREELLGDAEDGTELYTLDEDGTLSQIVVGHVNSNTAENKKESNTAEEKEPGLQPDQALKILYLETEQNRLSNAEGKGVVLKQEKDGRMVIVEEDTLAEVEEEGEEVHEETVVLKPTPRILRKRTHIRDDKVGGEGVKKMKLTYTGEREILKQKKTGQQKTS